MGRQFSYFLGPDDLAPFEEALKSIGNIAFIQDRPVAPRAIEIPHLSQSDIRTLLCRQQDLPTIKFTPVSTQSFSSANCFYENIVECDVIKGTRNGYLIEGRLYYHSIYYDTEGKKVHKSPEFLKWCETLFRRTKKSLTYVDHWFYAGAHALQMRAEGYKFNQLDGWAPR